MCEDDNYTKFHADFLEPYIYKPRNRLLFFVQFLLRYRLHSRWLCLLPFSVPTSTSQVLLVGHFTHKYTVSAFEFCSVFCYADLQILQRLLIRTEGRRVFPFGGFWSPSCRRPCILREDKLEMCCEMRTQNVNLHSPLVDRSMRLGLIKLQINIRR